MQTAQQDEKLCGGGEKVIARRACSQNF